MPDDSQIAKPPLVLVHGFPLDRRAWDDVMTRLIATRRVLTPDLKGFGERAKEPVKGMTMEMLADDLHERLDVLKALPCVLGGLSMGGYVALAFAKKYPSDVSGLVLCDTKCTADTPEGKEARLKMIELVKQSGTPGVVEQMLPKMLAKQTHDARAEVVARLKSIMLDCPASTIEEACVAMRDREDFTDVLRAIDVPVLTIVGAHDAITPPDVAEAMSNHVRKELSSLRMVEDAGHMAPMEQPNDVSDAIEGFFETL